MDSLLHKELAQRDALVDHSVHGTIFHQGGLRDMCSRALGMKGLFFQVFP